MKNSSQVLAFDVYGTLLDTSGISTTLCRELQVSSLQADQISALWRTYQLQYTWRLNSMGLYEPFNEVTRKSLLHAVLDHKINLSDALITSICDAYNTLPVFPDVYNTLQKLDKQPDVKIVIFSNGTRQMISTSLDRASLTPYTNTCFLTDSVRKYKPSPEVYSSLFQSCAEYVNDPKDIWLVSGNPFDVTGARNAGLNAIWVDRVGKGWTDRLFDETTLGPTKIVKSLEDIPGYF